MADFDVALESSEINVTLVLERTVGGEGGGGVTSWNDLEDKPATFPPSTHTHDDRYYTETEIDTALALKSDTSHNHDSRYYTETEIDTALALKSDTSHNHDSRYYTETEIDALLAPLKFPKIAPTTGDYYSMGGQTSATSPGLTVAGKIILHPLWLDIGTLDRIAVSTSVAAASTYRLGLYKANPTTGLPDGQTPFLDAGTVDMNATAGVQAITINKQITEPGLYWAAVLVDAYTAQPTTHCVVYSSNTGLGIQGLPQDMSSLGRYRTARVYNSTVATGSLPTVPSSSMSWAGVAPRVAVRYT